jgi:orotidine-5'-phosphate decarboxylase
MTFQDKLKTAVPSGIGLCVGLDPVVAKMPAKFQSSPTPLFDFCRDLIDATKDFASAYKPNAAFFEVYGADGWQQLKDTVAAIPSDKIKIIDAKRGDIGSTAEAYADALFGYLKGDATTLSPYLGGDAIQPFLKKPEFGGYLLAVTSNPGGADLQELLIDNEPLYLHVVRLAKKLAINQNVGLVVGATRQSLWAKLLETAVDLPLLIPGVGAQGGDPVSLREMLRDYPGVALVNSSRDIIYASQKDDYQSAARDAAAKLSNLLTGK